MELAVLAKQEKNAWDQSFTRTSFLTCPAGTKALLGPLFNLPSRDNLSIESTHNSFSDTARK